MPQVLKKKKNVSLEIVGPLGYRTVPNLTFRAVWARCYYTYFKRSAFDDMFATNGPRFPYRFLFIYFCFLFYNYIHARINEDEIKRKKQWRQHKRNKCAIISGSVAISTFSKMKLKGTCPLKMHQQEIVDIGLGDLNFLFYFFNIFKGSNINHSIEGGPLLP